MFVIQAHRRPNKRARRDLVTSADQQSDCSNDTLQQTGDEVSAGQNLLVGSSKAPAPHWVIQEHSTNLPQHQTSAELLPPPPQSALLELGSERHKMITGQLYNASDPQLVHDRLFARDQLHRECSSCSSSTLCLLLTLHLPLCLSTGYNATNERRFSERQKALSALLRNCSSDISVQAPFFCDYGYLQILFRCDARSLQCLISSLFCQLQI